MERNRFSLFFVLHLPPPVHGASMVGQYIHDSSVINETFDCHYANLSMAEGMQDIGRFSFSKISNLFKLIRKIRKEIKQQKPALVYITPNASGKPFYKDYLVVQAVKSIGVKVVLHFHNKGVKDYSGNFLNHQLYKRFFRNTKVILLSRLLYPDVEKYVDEKDVYVCPNGIPEPEAIPSVEQGTPRLLFLSNLIVSKGLVDLLDACEILRKKGVKFECSIVGAETEEFSGEKLQKEIDDRGLTRNVRYLGKKYGKDKEEVYAQSDVFVFPTYYPNECFPLVLLEAMQHSLPCVSTREGAIPDIISDGETGLIVKRQSPHDVARALERLLLSKDLRSKMGCQARRKYEEHFTLSHFEQQLRSILKEMA